MSVYFKSLNDTRRPTERMTFRLRAPSVRWRAGRGTNFAPAKFAGTTRLPLSDVSHCKCYSRPKPRSWSVFAIAASSILQIGMAGEQ
jgi:hypothetical protein